MVTNQINQVSVVRLPLNTKFRGLDHREVMIFKGSERFSEFSPFLEYGDQESATWLKAALEYANEPLPDQHRTKIAVNATLPAVRPDLISSVLAPFGTFGTVKIKVGGAGSDLEQDLARVLETNRLFPEAKIRLDANGCFSVAEAVAFSQKITALPIEYFEQPVATIEELVQLRHQLQTAGIELKIAADESIRKAVDPLEVSRLGAADIAVLKVQPLGGIRSALEIARASSLAPVVSSALESSIGIAHGLQLAASLTDLDYACGLATASLLAADVVTEPLIPTNGFLEVTEPVPDQALLKQFAVDAETQANWHQRLDRCLALLES